MLEAPWRAEFIAFEWARDPGGYRLAKARPYNYLAMGPAALPRKSYPEGTRILEGKTGELVEYTPQASAALHRLFAELSDDPQELIQFANQYGLLADEAGPESVADMFALRDRVKAVVAALDRAARASGETAVKRKFNAAKVYAKHGSPWLTVAPHAATDANGVTSLSLKARPARLFDYMLLMAASEMLGRVEIRRCVVCEEWFEVGPGRHRRDKVTCSEKCKKARQRMEAAHATQR